MGDRKNNFIYVLWGGNEDFVDIWGGGLESD